MAGQERRRLTLRLVAFDLLVGFVVLLGVVVLLVLLALQLVPGGTD